MRYLLLFNLVLAAALTIMFPHSASASGAFGAPEDDACLPITLQKVTVAPVTYTFSGVCNLAHTRLALPIKVPYTAIGTYDAATGKTIEDLNIPPPPISEPSRPYGRFYATMHCAADPWRNPAENLKCDQIAASVNPPRTAWPPNDYGNYARAVIDQIIPVIQSTRRPYSSMKAAVATQQNQAALTAAQGKSELLLQGAKQSSGAYSALLHPTVLAPTAGQTQPAQRPIPIKLAPPKGWNVTGYMVTIERKDAKGNWVAHATIPVGAAQAQSAAGYTGFGNGAPPAFLAVPGRYRLNAQASYPNKSGVSDWVEFTATEYQDFTTTKKQRSPFFDAFQKK
jgi:hypothetical protein